ncbi:DUF924 domain-containing protein [Patescibacteria group bacterium]|nr:DUF924 domain-containing protein [Patescibacteria group bacterium]
MKNSVTPQEIIHFWFVENGSEQWFQKDAEFDECIRARFLNAYNDALHDKTAEWRTTPEGRLAEILVLDQFARNMFRGTPQAFSGDQKALALAKEAISAGDDTKLDSVQRQFLYMPYMHSESREVHEEAVALFEKLGNPQTLEYEVLHKEIIDQFGRYPHRNSILGRESTPKEEEFLKNHEGF